jgi:hypothetical protein
VQRQFDEASAALAAGDWATALAQFSDVEARLASGKTPGRTAGIVKLRKAKAAFALGRQGEGLALLEEGLALLDDKDPVLGPEIFEAHHGLGKLKAGAFDYHAALAHFARATAIAPGNGYRVTVLLDRVRFGLWLDRDDARATLDEVDAILARSPKALPEWHGLARQYRGRLLLNEGKAGEARSHFDAAIKAFGGLRLGKVDYLDTTARGDAAIAALRDGDENGAKRPLAYAGASLHSELGFEGGLTMEPPPCGGPMNLMPDDVAVVQLSISAQGTVTGAEPVFFTGVPAKAVAYAQAVSRWTWSREELERVSPFFRSQTRVEIRCTVAFGREVPERLLIPAAVEWMKANGIAALAELPARPAESQAFLEAELARRTAAYGAASPPLLPVLMALLTHPLTPREERRRYAGLGRETALATKAPASVRAPFEFAYASLASGMAVLGDKQAAALLALLEQPDLNADSRVRAAVILGAFESLRRETRLRDGVALLRRVADDTTLFAVDPLKVGALVRLANLSVQAGKIEQARGYFERTGLGRQKRHACRCPSAEDGWEYREQRLSTRSGAMGNGRLDRGRV